MQDDLYDKGNISLEGREWSKINYYHAANEASVTCDFVKDNNKRCGKKIHNVIVVQHTKTMEILKIGSTCSRKLLGSNSNLTIEQLEEKRTEITNLKEELMDIIKDTDVSQSEVKKQYTNQEQEELIKEALNQNILSSELKKLLTNGIPLSNSQYIQLEKNIFKLKNEKNSLSLNYQFKDSSVDNLLIPGNAISLILHGIGITEINENTDSKDYELIVISLIDYTTSTAFKDKRKTINFKEIYRSIEANYEINPSETHSIMNRIFEIALTYLNNQKNKYRMLNCDFHNFNFIFLYL